MGNPISKENMKIISQLISTADDKLVQVYGDADDNSVSTITSLLNALVRGGNDLNTGIVSGGVSTIALNKLSVTYNTFIASIRNQEFSTDNPIYTPNSTSPVIGEVLPITIYGTLDAGSTMTLNAAYGDPSLPEHVVYPLISKNQVFFGNILLGNSGVISSVDAVSFCSALPSTGFHNNAQMQLFNQTKILKSAFISDGLQSQRLKFAEFINAIETLTLSETGQDLRTYYGPYSTEAVVFDRGFKEVYKACRGVYPYKIMGVLTAHATVDYDDLGILPSPVGMQLKVLDDITNDYAITIHYIDGTITTLLGVDSDDNDLVFVVVDFNGFSGVDFIKIDAEVMVLSNAVSDLTVLSRGDCIGTTSATEVFSVNSVASDHLASTIIYGTKKIIVTVPSGTTAGTLIPLNISATDIVMMSGANNPSEELVFEVINI